MREKERLATVEEGGRMLGDLFTRGNKTILFKLVLYNIVAALGEDVKQVCEGTLSVLERKRVVTPNGEESIYCEWMIKKGVCLRMFTDVDGEGMNDSCFVCYGGGEDPSSKTVSFVADSDSFPDEVVLALPFDTNTNKRILSLLYTTTFAKFK